MTKRRRRALFAALVLTLATLLVTGSARADSTWGAAGSARAYAALGDSFSAGFGSPDALTTGSARACAQTHSAYPQLLAADPALTQLNFVACSNSYTADVVGPMPLLLGSLAPQVRALSPATKVVTLTIGGNDAGFPALLYCFGTPGCDPTSLKPRASTGLAALAGTGDALDDRGRPITGIAEVIAALSAAAPNARILIAGYPLLFGGTPACSATAWVDELTRELNAVIREAATTSAAKGVHVTYVDVTAAFSGHGTCDADSWIDRRTFHPTSDGQRAYADAFRAASTEVTRG